MSVDFSLAGKVVLLTGSAGILGQAFCAELLEQGAIVIGIDCNNSAQDHKNFYPVVVDIADDSEVKKAVDKIINKHKKIDVLINNAATKTTTPRRFFADDLDYDPSVWNEVVGVNLNASFWLIKHVGKQMLKQKSGSIIQIASLYGVVAADQRIYEGSEYLGGPINTPAVYSATKAAVLGLVKHFAAKWGEFGVRVNAISPGGVSSGQNSVFSEKYSARVPMGHMAEKKDLLGALVYLASNASSYMTGQNLIVDGGLTVW